MKKRAWLFLLLFVLASMNVIGTDRLLLRAGESRQTKAPAEDQNGEPTDTPNKNGVPPKEIAAVIEEELQLFPIPKSFTHPEYRVTYEDSWMSERTFGGDRGHEGTDLMLDPDKRGLFPVLSMTDGIIEKQGWLPQGGYRIGIRSNGGIYYYYAHLYDYAPDLEPGVSVTAGQLLGFAGDSGYSNIEGTVGNFPSHLHIGIYYDNEEDIETSINPYPFLLPLKQITLEF